MRRLLVLLVTCLLLRIAGVAQAPTRIAIRAGQLIDGRSEKPLENLLILIKKDKIVSVTAGGNAPPGVEVVDLANATVLPGFIDVHTHVLVQGDASSEEYDAQLLKQSIPYRAILAARSLVEEFSFPTDSTRISAGAAPRRVLLRLVHCRCDSGHVVAQAGLR